MMSLHRAPFNVLALPYRMRLRDIEFAVFHRPNSELWQFIAGGGEGNETPFEAAIREAREEAGIEGEGSWIRLDSVASIPRSVFPDAEWPEGVYVIPGYCFAVNVGHAEIRLSGEHDRFEWLDYDAAHSRLTWDSNRVALWELHERLIAVANPGVAPLGHQK